MLTKTQTKIMEFFVSRIDEKFSIKNISETLKKPYPLIHRSVKALIKNIFIVKDKRNLLSLNYRENCAELAYIESLRKGEFLRRNETVSLFVNDVLEKIDSDFFIFLIFGSSVRQKQKPRDIDVLVITENKININDMEKFLHNTASNFSLKFDINVIPVESAYEMLSKRDDINIMSETLNNHILLFGGENYYRLLKNAR